MDNHSTCGLSARGLDLPHEGDVYVFLKESQLAGDDSSVVNDAERTVAEVATSENMNQSTKYPVEPPGSGTSSREATSQPIKNERFETPSENVGDGDLMSMSVP